MPKLPPLGPPPRASSEVTSKVMKANKARDTTPEISLRKALVQSGLSGYRLNWKGVTGRPDIAYPAKRLAIFVNGCFWHRCPKCAYPLPKTNADFWALKFKRNEERDQRKCSQLKEAGWSVLTFWECDITDDLRSCVGQIKKTLMELSGM